MSAEPKKSSVSMKSFLPRTLFGRSLLILVLPVVLLQLVTSYMFFDRLWTKMTMRLAFAVAGEIAVIVDSIEEGADPEKVKDITNYTKHYLELDVAFHPGAELSDDHKIGAGDVWEAMVVDTLLQELRGTLRRPFVLTTDFRQDLLQVSVQITDGVLLVSVPVRRLFSSSGYTFLLWMIGTSMGLLVVAIVFMRNQIRPIRKLAIAAERFGKGRDVPSFKPSGAREVRQAAEAFLDMHKRIRRQIGQRTAMLAGVSHDLRTPLTRLRLQLEMMGTGPDIDAMKSDLQEMERMIGGYLEFVRGGGDEAAVYTDLNALLDKVVEATRRHGQEVLCEYEDSLMIMLRPMAFERCMTNLLSNAEKHADHVWVRAYKGEDGEDIFVVIDDDGPGIVEEEFEDVFKPFYRVDSSRNVSTGGVGLGLPIAMDVVHAHGGKIWLEKSDRGGLRVNIRLPL